MKININGKDFEIDDAIELNISFTGNLDKLSVNENNQAQKIVRGNRTINQMGGVYLENGNIINYGQYSESMNNTSIGQGITINIEGNINHTETENGTVLINGEVTNIKTYNGNVSVTGDVKGNIQTHNGNVKVSGSVAGSVKTHNGNIKTGG